MSERLPAPDADRVAACVPRDDELVTVDDHVPVVRIHATAGSYPCAWDAFQAWGPTRSRFDHQPEPRRAHRYRRVAYVTLGEDAFTAAVAEFFQDDDGRVGPVDVVHRAPFATVFRFAAPVTLLDLDSGWVTRAGGNQAIRSGPRGPARRWARSIYRYHGQRVDGVTYGSSVWGPGQCAALWERAERALPAAPEASRALADPLLVRAVHDAAALLGTYVVDR